MIFKYESNSLKSGIYKITNTHTNRVYIGQAKEFKSRWKAHCNSLRINKHSNKFLQNDYNKCMEELKNDDFLVFEVLELMEKSTKKQRNKKEQYWINQFYDNKTNCYNIEKMVNHPGQSCFSHTPELTRKKQSQITKNLWADPDYRNKMEAASEQKSVAMKKVCSDEKYKERHKKTMKKKWKDPKYKVKVSAAMRKQIKENPDKLIKQSEYMKETWKDPKYKEKISTAIKKSYDVRMVKLRAIIVDPNGKEYEVFNITRFAEEYGLHRKLLNNLILRKIKSTYGWTLKNTTDSKGTTVQTIEDPTIKQDEQ